MESNIQLSLNRDLPGLSISCIRLRGKIHLLLRFDYDLKLIQALRSIQHSRWNPTKRGWTIPFDDGEYEALIRRLRRHFTILKLPEDIELYRGNPLPHHASLIDRFVDWLDVRRYSNRTIQTYRWAIITFLKHFPEEDASKLKGAHVHAFNRDHILKNKYSSSMQNQVLSAIKLFYRVVDNREMDLDQLRRPRKERKLPNVLSKEEVKMILDAPQNEKHRMMLIVLYACGLRRSELLKMKPGDIHRERNMLLIRQGKGFKDRMVPISDHLIGLLEDYYRRYRPRVYLFEGHPEGTPYSASALGNVLRQAVKRCGITRPVTLHWLRHSYATHLLESGTDLRYIQTLLGHKSSRTTEIYTHVSMSSIQAIKSPFDSL